MASPVPGVPGSGVQPAPRPGKSTRVAAPPSSTSGATAGTGGGGGLVSTASMRVEDMVELDPVTGEPVMSRALKRHLSMRPGQHRATQRGAGPETVSDADGDGAGSDGSLSDWELQTLDVEPDAAAAAALEEQRRASLEQPMSSVVDWATILRMKQIGRQRRMLRRRAAARSNHEQELQDYLQQHSMSVANRLLHPDDQRRLEDSDGKAEPLVLCDLQADFSLQPWYYVEEEQPVATLSYLPRSLRLVKSVIELYFKLGAGIDLFFHNPTTEVLEAVPTNDAFLAAFKEWDGTKGERRLAQLVRRMDELGKFLLTALKVFDPAQHAAGNSSTATSSAAKSPKTKHAAAGGSAAKPAPSGGLRVDVTSASSVQAVIMSPTRRRSGAGVGLTVSTGVRTIAMPQPREAGPSPVAVPSLRRAAVQTAQAALPPIRQRLLEEYLTSLPPNRRGTLPMTTLPVPPPQRAGDGAKPLTPEEWFARAWDVAEEVHGYCLHSRVHMQVLEHVLKPLATVLTFFDEHHVTIPPAVANSCARCLWAVLCGGVGGGGDAGVQASAAERTARTRRLLMLRQRLGGRVKPDSDAAGDEHGPETSGAEPDVLMSLVQDVDVASLLVKVFRTSVMIPMRLRQEAARAREVARTVMAKAAARSAMARPQPPATAPAVVVGAVVPEPVRQSVEAAATGLRRVSTSRNVLVGNGDELVPGQDVPQSPATAAPTRSLSPEQVPATLRRKSMPVALGSVGGGPSGKGGAAASSDHQQEAARRMRRASSGVYVGNGDDLAELQAEKQVVGSDVTNDVASGLHVATATLDEAWTGAALPSTTPARRSSLPTPRPKATLRSHGLTSSPHRRDRTPKVARSRHRRSSSMDSVASRHSAAGQRSRTPPIFSVSRGGRRSSDADLDMSLHQEGRVYNPHIPTQYQPRYEDEGWTSNQDMVRRLNRFRPHGGAAHRNMVRTASWKKRRKAVKRARRKDLDEEKSMPKGWAQRILSPSHGRDSKVRAASRAAKSSGDVNEVVSLYDLVTTLAGCASSLALTAVGRSKLLATPAALVMLASIACTDSNALPPDHVGLASTATTELDAAADGSADGGRGDSGRKAELQRLSRCARDYALQALCACVSRAPKQALGSAGGMRGLVASLGSVMSHAHPWHGPSFARGGAVPWHNPALWLPLTADFIHSDPVPAGADPRVMDATDPDGVSVTALKAWVCLHSMLAVVSQQLLHDFTEPPNVSTNDFDLEDGCEDAAAAALTLFGPIPPRSHGELEPGQPCEREEWLSGLTNAMAGPAVLMASLRVARWIMSHPRVQAASHHRTLRRRSISAMQSLAPRPNFSKEAVLMPAVLCGNVHALIRYHKELQEPLPRTAVSLIGETVEVLVSMMWCPRRNVALAAARALANVLYTCSGGKEQRHHSYGGQGAHGATMMGDKQGKSGRVKPNTPVSAAARAAIYLSPEARRRRSLGSVRRTSTGAAFVVGASPGPRGPRRTDTGDEVSDGGGSDGGSDSQSERSDGASSATSSFAGEAPPMWVVLIPVVFERAIAFGGMAAAMSALQRWRRDTQGVGHARTRGSDPAPQRQPSPKRAGGTSTRAGAAKRRGAPPGPRPGVHTGGPTSSGRFVTPEEAAAAAASENELVSVMLSVLSQLLTRATASDRARVLRANGPWRILQATSAVTGAPLLLPRPPTPPPTPQQSGGLGFGLFGASSSLGFDMSSGTVPSSPSRRRKSASRRSRRGSGSSATASSTGAPPEEDLRLPPVPVPGSASVSGSRGDMPNDPALVPEAYVRECAAVCWMRLADADVTSTRPPEELRAVLHLMATQAVGEGLRAWTLALWGLAHDPINQRSLVRLGAIPVVNARISEVRAMVVETVRSLATKETAASMDMQMSILGDKVHVALNARLRELECLVGLLWLLICNGDSVLDFRREGGIVALMSLLHHHDSHEYGKAATRAAKAAKRLKERRRRKEERDKQLGLWQEPSEAAKAAAEAERQRQEAAKHREARQRTCLALLLMPVHRLALNAMLEVLLNYKRHHRTLLNGFRLEAVHHGLLRVCESMVLNVNLPVTIRVVATNVYRLMSHEREGGITHVGAGDGVASPSNAASPTAPTPRRRPTRTLNAAVGYGPSASKDTTPPPPAPSPSAARRRPSIAALAASTALGSGQDQMAELTKAWRNVTSLAVVGVRFLSPGEHFVIRNLGTTLLEESVAIGSTRKHLASNGGLAALTQYLEHAYAAYVDFRTEDERRVHGQEVDSVDARASGEAEDPAIALAAGRTRRSSVARRHNIRQRRGSVSSVRSSASARSRLSMHDFIVQAVAGETSGGMKMLLQDPDKHDPYAVTTRSGAAKIMQKLLNILLNLSVERQSQIDIGLFGLDLLMAVLNDKSLPVQCSELVSRVLINAARHPANRSKLYAANLRKYAEPLLDAAAGALDRHDEATAVLDSKAGAGADMGARLLTARTAGTTQRLSDTSTSLLGDVPPQLASSDNPYDERAWRWLLSSPVHTSRGHGDASTVASGSTGGDGALAVTRRGHGGVLTSDDGRRGSRTSSRPLTRPRVSSHLAFPDDDPQQARRPPMGAAARAAHAAAKARSIEARYPPTHAPELPAKKLAFTKHLAQGVDGQFERPHMLVRPFLQTAEGAGALARPLQAHALTLTPLDDPRKPESFMAETQRSLGVTMAPPKSPMTVPQQAATLGATRGAKTPLPRTPMRRRGGALHRTPTAALGMSASPLARGGAGLAADSTDGDGLVHDPRAAIDTAGGVGQILRETFRHRTLTRDGRRALAKLGVTGGSSSALALTARSGTAPGRSRGSSRGVGGRSAGGGGGVTTFTEQELHALRAEASGEGDVPCVGEMLNALGQLPPWAQQQLHLHPHQLAAMGGGDYSVIASDAKRRSGRKGEREQALLDAQQAERDSAFSEVGGYSLESENRFRNTAVDERWAPDLDVMAVLPKDARRMSTHSMASQVLDKDKMGLWPTLLDEDKKKAKQKEHEALGGLPDDLAAGGADTAGAAAKKADAASPTPGGKSKSPTKATRGSSRGTASKQGKRAASKGKGKDGKGGKGKGTNKPAKPGSPGLRSKTPSNAVKKGKGKGKPTVNTNVVAPAGSPPSPKHWGDKTPAGKGGKSPASLHSKFKNAAAVTAFFAGASNVRSKQHAKLVSDQMAAARADAHAPVAVRVKPGTSARHQFVFGMRDFVEAPGYTSPPFQFVTAKDYREQRLAFLPGSWSRAKAKGNGQASGDGDDEGSSYGGSRGIGSTEPDVLVPKLRPKMFGKPLAAPPATVLDQLEAEDEAEAADLGTVPAGLRRFSRASARRTARSRRSRRSGTSHGQAGAAGDAGGGGDSSKARLLKSQSVMGASEALKRMGTSFGQSKDQRLAKLKLLIERKRKQQEAKLAKEQSQGKAARSQARELQQAFEAAGGGGKKVGKDGQVKRDYQDWQWDNNWDWDFVQGRWRNDVTDALEPEGELAKATEQGVVDLEAVQDFVLQRREAYRELQARVKADMVQQIREQEMARARAVSAAGTRPTASRAERRDEAKAQASKQVSVADQQRRMKKAQAQARAISANATYEGPSVQLCSFEHVPGATVCKHLYRHYRLPDGRLVHMYLTDRLHEQVQGLADPDPPPPLALDDICQVQVPPPPPPPRIVHDQAQATGRQLAYGDGANHKATPTTAMARLRSEARAMTPQRPLRPKVVLPYRFRVPLAASPDVYGPAPPLPPDEPPMFVVVRKRRRYRGKDLKAELAAQAAKFRKRQEVLLQKHVITSANSFKFASKVDRKLLKAAKAGGGKGKGRKGKDRLVRAMLRAAHMPEWCLLDPFEFVFCQRVFESAAMDVYDNDRVMEECLDMDWRRIMTKLPLRSKLLEACNTDVGKLERCRRQLQANIRIVYDVFDYYCILTSGEAFAMRGNAFREFVERCQLLVNNPNVPDELQRPLSRRECDAMFQQANVETLSGAENQQNWGKALMRFEFVEVIIRLALHKYYIEGERELEEALILFIDEHIRRYCGPEIAHNRNDFRYDRLYRKPVSKVLQVHAPFIDALYEYLTKRFANTATAAGMADFTSTNVTQRGKAIARRLPMRAWIDMINEAKLVDSHFTMREARLAFTWSRMRTPDELLDRVQCITLSATDFMEALARVADMKWLPTAHDLRAVGVSNCYDFFQRMKGFSRRQRSRLVREIRRESFGISMLRRFRNAALRRPSHAPPADAPEPVMGQLSAWQPEERYRPRQNPALTDVVEAARAAAAKSQNAGALAVEDGSAADAGEQESKGEAPVAGSSRRPPTTGSNRPPTSGSTGSRPQTASEKLLRGQKNRIHDFGELLRFNQAVTAQEMEGTVKELPDDLSNELDTHVTRPLSNRLEALFQLLYGHYIHHLKDAGLKVALPPEASVNLVEPQTQPERGWRRGSTVRMR